jgi:two-component system NtrC family sensor kinase
MSMGGVRAALTAPGRLILGGKGLPAAIVPWLLFAAAAVLAAVGYRQIRTFLPAGDLLPYLLATVAVAVAAALALRVMLYRRGIAAIHRAILSAQDGSLVPIAPPAFSRHLLGRLFDDYNLLARNLGSLFQEMEQCQLWIIGERNRNDAILRSLPGALFTVDGDFRVTVTNRAAEDVFGREREALLGQNLFDLLDLDQDGRELLREAFLYEQQIFNREIHLTVAGQPRYFTLNLTFFASQTESESSAVIILQDITGYKRLLETAHQNEKLVAMGQLAAGVAHELNTPLGTIIGYAQLLRSGQANDEKHQHYTQTIYGEAKRCARIIDNLLAYARRDRCQPENSRINDVIRDVVATIDGCQGKRYRARIETRLAGDPLVHGGPGQLDIVLVNLIMNAIQAAGGTAEQPHVVVESRVEEAAAVVSITDNGPGIPPELRHRVFDPFFTTKEVGSGTGLGLAISHSIVSRIGGTVRCDPAYNGGARFVLTLPLADGA